MKNFFAVEGIDGCGKTSVITAVSNRMKDEGRSVEVVKTCEKEEADVYKNVVDEYSLSPMSPAYMFFFQMLHAKKAERVKSYLMGRNTVIADRWDLSFFAWHNNFGFFADEDQSLRDGISRLAFQGVEPDHGIYLDVDIDLAFERRLKNRGDKDIVCFKSERELYEKVVKTYKQIVLERGWKVIDANQSFEQVSDEVYNLILSQSDII